MEEKTTNQKAFIIFITYFKAMIFAFTGGNVVWPLVEDAFCNKYKLIGREKALEYYALGQSLPGTLSLNTALLIGREVAGWRGVVAAGAGNILPAFFGMLLIIYLYTLISGLAFLNRAISGIRAASVAIIAVMAITIIKRAKGVLERAIVVLAFLAVFVFKINIFLVIIICGIIGIIGFNFSKSKTTKED